MSEVVDDFSNAPHTRSLAQLAKGESARILGLVAAGCDASVDLTRRLADLGFLPGEPVRVLARGALAGEPIAVRIGTSTFALRRHEAACVLIACPACP
jgi:ferrous iron transport protein A